MNRRRKRISLNHDRAAYLGAAILGTEVVANFATEVSENKQAYAQENMIGFDRIGAHHNVTVHENNFVVVHVNPLSGTMDQSFINSELKKCEELDVSVTISLDSIATNVSDAYKEIEYVEALGQKYFIDMPIYLNIDNLMANSNLSNEAKASIIGCYVERCQLSNICLGFTGTDSNLALCNSYVMNLSNYSVFLTQEETSSSYNLNNVDIVRYTDGSIHANSNLAMMISEGGYNKGSKMVYSGQYVVQEGETYHTIALKFGLSEDDLKAYNNNRSISNGGIISVPNLYRSIDVSGAHMVYERAIARGIDITSETVNIDWDKVSNTSDYVMVQLSFDKKVYPDNTESYNLEENKGIYLDSAASNVSEAVSRNISVGLFCEVEDDMKIAIFKERVANYFSKLDSDLETLGCNVNKANVPVFLSFENYYKWNNYYSLMQTFEEEANRHGFTKVGISASENVLYNIVSNMKDLDGVRVDFNNMGWYVWQTGGSQYCTGETMQIPVDEVVEEDAVSDLYEIDMQQATNVASETGASNSNGNVSLGYLYTNELFGDSLESGYYTTSFMGVNTKSTKDYANVPVYGLTGALTTGMNVALSALIAWVAFKKSVQHYYKSKRKKM